MSAPLHVVILAAGEGKRWTELELDEQDRYFDLAKEAGT